jgi:hypothetical protein
MFWKMTKSIYKLKEDFYTRYFLLQELCLQLSILYKENLISKEKQGKTQDSDRIYQANSEEKGP